MRCLTGALALVGLAWIASPTHAQTISPDQLVFLTAEWKGERFADGRPKVADSIVARMKKVSIEEAWELLRTQDRKSTRLNSSHLVISYAVFCLKKKKKRHRIRLSLMSSVIDSRHVH